MFKWYHEMTVTLKWGPCTSEPIRVTRGTRQGGLTSPLLFNVFYKDLITRLDEMDCGVTIKGQHYNVFCYADDILLASTTPLGLQKLVDEAVSTIKRDGLRFNPEKTMVMTFGSKTLKPPPSWTICDTVLNEVDCLTYLGAQLQDDSGRAHAKKRISAAQKAFYGLQGAGLHFQGVDPAVASHIYSVGVRTVLLYGCEAVNLSNSNLKEIQVQQGKLIKRMLGLKKWSRTTPLQQALRIPAIKTSVGLSTLGLLKSCLRHPSKATNFYSMLLQGPTAGSPSLVARAHSYAKTFNADVFNYVFNDSYSRNLQSKVKQCPNDDGFIDSIILILSDYHMYGARDLLQLFLNTF